MKILLDTNAWIWWLTNPAMLNRNAAALLGDPASVIYLSAASVLEIVIKHTIGKLVLPAAPEQLLPRAMAEDRLIELPIQHRHALQVATLPLHHRDPFDRLIIAQARVEGLPIMTADQQFTAYDAELIPAR